MSEPTPFSPSERLHAIPFAVPRDLIELALDGSGVGLWEWDVVSGRSTHSRMNSRMLGYEDSEPLGNTYAELVARIHPDDAKEMRAKVDQHFRNETPFYQAEFRVLRKDGTFAWLESRGIVVERSLDGQPLRMIGFHLDISDRKANEQLRRDLESALRRNQEELEALVRLQTRRLIETAAAAEQGNRAKNVLLARVGHELRAPLGVVIDSCARLLDGHPGELPPQAREHLELIRQSAQQFSERVERLVDVSRIETNTLEICCTSVNLRHVLQEQCEAMQARALERGLDLRAVSCAEDLVVFADRARLAQVVSELLTNAIKFTDRGYVQVRARVLDGAVLVEVQDTGIGIPPERLTTVFHAFQPIADQQPVLREGLGLGLSISRAVIEAMGGSIGVTGKAGHGSRFWFTLPLAASAQRVSSTRH
ncbi:MAG TPA: ATP-binding protein [Steroidobacteraceae bacterium]|nr:ATP-binding protein [Steroidobacteraceae bacterium]